MSLTKLCYDDDSTLMSLPVITNDAEPGPSTQFTAPSSQVPSAHAYLEKYLHTLIGYLCMYTEDYRIAMRAGREHWMQSREDAVVGGVFELMQDSAQATLRREFKNEILPDLLALPRSLGPLSPTVSRMDATIEAWVKEEWRAKEPAVVAQVSWTSAHTLLTTKICRLETLVPNIEHVFRDQVPALPRARSRESERVRQLQEL